MRDFLSDIFEDDGSESPPGLEVKPDGKLVRSRWVYDEEQGKGEYVFDDVTYRATEFLNTDVELDEKTTLRDVFLILNSNPVLAQFVYRQDFSEGLLAEALDPSAPPPRPSESPNDEIEYLEIYQSWSKNSRTNEIRIGRWDFHGIGIELPEDIVEGGSVEDGGFVIHPKGSRIRWGLSFSNPRDLLHLPLRVCRDVHVREDDFKSGNAFQTIETVNRIDITLNDVFHAILWELSWHGVGKERDEKLNEIILRADDVRGQVKGGE